MKTAEIKALVEEMQRDETPHNAVAVARLCIALPQLGCGCGGLDWAEVWPLYEKHLGGLDADVEVWIWL